MAFRIINVFDGDKIRLNLNNLIVSSKEYEYSIPIHDIDVLLLNDFKTVITIRVINKLIESNVCIITCNENYEPVSYMLPVAGHCSILKTATAQTKWTEQQKAVYWKENVKFKILNQIDVLKMETDQLEVCQKMYQLIDELELDDKTNREGHAAKIYFHALFGKNFKRFHDDGRNFALNYGYTILRGAIVRTICAKGLMPFLSIKHKSEGNYFALADDLIEPFRPLVDLYVKKYVDEESIYLSKQHRTNLVQLLNQKVIWNQKELFLTQAIEKSIDQLISFFDNGDFPMIYPQIYQLEFDFENEY